jgi:putative ATPase
LPLVFVKKGWITLIGATTENPSFEVISPAPLSRCQVYVLNAFTKADLEVHCKGQCIQMKTKTIKKLKEKEALCLLAVMVATLNIFELVINASVEEQVVITNERVSALVYASLVMTKLEQHYDIVSAFIKSIRGSDSNGAV